MMSTQILVKFHKSRSPDLFSESHLGVCISFTQFTGRKVSGSQKGPSFNSSNLKIAAALCSIHSTFWSPLPPHPSYKDGQFSLGRYRIFCSKELPNLDPLD